MHLPRLLVVMLACAVSGSVLAQESATKVRNDVVLLRREGIGSPAGRAAWQRLAHAGPKAIPLLLEGMDAPGIVPANWLFTALERIIVDEKAARSLDLDRIFQFAQDSRRQGRARRVALEIVEKYRPGTTRKLLPGWTDDPEFRADAIDHVLELAAKAKATGNREEALRQFRLAFDSSRDIEQARDAAVGLLDLGTEVGIARHLGFLTDWHLLGPFDGMGRKGYHLAYPPEKTLDLKATYEARGKKLSWKPYSVKEPSPRVKAKHVALVNLRESRALGDADDAVAFAYAEIHLDRPRKVEFRGAADDNFTVWVNGRRVFGFEEYRNGIRFDRHRFPADLQAGRNTVLVKVCQTPAPNPEPNWEFILRVVDEDGRGLTWKNP